MQQRLHRQELKLARLKHMLGRNRQAKERLQLRLGGLLYLVNWENLPESELDIAIKSVARTIEVSKDLDSLKASGKKFISDHESENFSSGNIRTPDDEKRRELINQKISKSAVLIKYELQDIDKETLLGAILAHSEKLGKTKTD